MSTIKIKEAMDILGFDSQPMVHAFIKRWDITKIKEGRRTFIDEDELNVAIEKAETTRGQRKVLTPEEKADRKARKAAKKGGADTEAAEELGFRPFATKPELLLWNKGEWRGWAFGAIADVTPDLIGVVKEYCSDLGYWLPKSIAESIGKKEMFILNPSQTVGFLAAQLMGSGDSVFDDVVMELEVIADKLKVIEKEYRMAEEGLESEGPEVVFPDDAAEEEYVI